MRGDQVRNGQYSGGWERLEAWVFVAYSSGAKALVLSSTCGMTEVVRFHKTDGKEFSAISKAHTLQDVVGLSSNRGWLG